MEDDQATVWSVGGVRDQSRYFAAPAAAAAPEKLIYLTGSHVNNNLHDGLGPGRECPDNPELFDFDAYLGCSRSVVTISDLPTPP